MSEASTVLVELSRWWFASPRVFVFMFIWAFVLPLGCSEDPHIMHASQQEHKFYSANINVSYVDRETRKEGFKKFEGKYGKNSIISSVSGVVLHALSVVNKSGTMVSNNFGCTNYVSMKYPSEHWIALVERGECSFTDKIKMATKDHNASAVVIYSNVNEGHTVMDHEQGLSSISVYMTQSDGKEIVELINKGYTVHMQINPGPEGIISTGISNSISKTSVLFVSISFIVLMIISLAWLVFYYIQRFRYSHAKERLARRLVCAAKKAIAKIPQRTLKVGDKELDSEFDQCAVCIEPYKAHDVVRILPCRHVFHKSCVDPWLLDQRSCPMCKLDILRAFGMQIGGSQESVHQDPEARPAAVISQEPEMSSSVEDTQAEEIKVLLIPHTCLHFRACDDEEASASLLGTGGDSIPNTSVSSQNSKGNRHSRGEIISSEMKALIGKGKGKKRKWRSKEECNDDEDDEDDDENITRGVGSVMTVIETAKKDQKEEKIVNAEEENIGDGSLGSSASSLQSLSSEQLTHQANINDGHSESGKTDNKDSQAVIIMDSDETVFLSATVKAKFQTSDNEGDQESRS